MLRPPARPVLVRLVAESAVPAGDVWLGPHELAVQAGLRFPKRRADWRRGRYAAKRAAAAWLGWASDPPALAALEVLADESGAPRLHGGGATPVALSLSHRAEWAVAAVAPGEVAIGCDLEVVEPRSGGFLADFLTPGEQAFVATGGPLGMAHRATLVWSVKECGLKALREGLRLDTRAVELVLREGAPEAGWRPVAARALPDGPTFEGWWRRAGSLLVCALGSPSLEVPSIMSLRSAGPAARVVPAPPPGTAVRRR